MAESKDANYPEDHVERQAALFAALSRAQGELKHASKGKENPFFHSHYADLAGIFDACRGVLAKNGLAIIQTTRLHYESEAVSTILVTTLVHSGGGFFSGEMPVKPVKDDPQGLGSALTYARRYALASIVGVAAEDEDDDGAGASTNERTERPAPKAGSTSKMRTTTKQDGSTVTEEEVHHSCGNRAIASKWPKAGATHFCGRCKASFEPMPAPGEELPEAPPF